MTVHVRAPASTANVGPGFDCAAVALELWNELEVSEGAGRPDRGHLGVRAFARLASVEGRRFVWTDRIPRRAGLGSSAATIALGLVAAALAEGEEPEPERLLATGAELEGHADNLAAALAGGVCLTWEGRIARLGDRTPAVPIAVVPAGEVSTAAARAALPDVLPHADATFSAGRAALLGAGLAAGSEELFAAALDDRLHEPYRAASAPLLGRLRAQPPPSALGVTLSGSGPTVIVWAREAGATECERWLSEHYRKERVLRLAVAAAGAGAVP